MKNPPDPQRLLSPAGELQATQRPELCSLLCTGAEASEEGLSAFTKLTQASVEALRYRGEDVEKSLTKNTVKEVRHPIASATVAPVPLAH